MNKKSSTIPKGYKSTKIGVLPVEWEVVRLKKIIQKFESGVSVNGENRKLEDGEIGVLKVSAVSYGVFDSSAAKAVIKDDLRRVKTNPKVGQIIISRANTPELVGASAYVDKDYPNLYLPDKLWQTITDSKLVNNRFLFAHLRSNRIQEQTKNLATGSSGSMKNISKPSFLSIQVPLPPLPEQQKIAQILTTWDDALQTLTQLIDAKKERKRGLMQRLLTGEVRLAGFEGSDKKVSTKYGDYPQDWQRVKIGDIATEVSVKNKNGEDYPVMSCTKYAGLVDSLSYFGKRVFSKNTSTYKMVKRGEFAYATNHIEEGSIGYQNIHDVGLISPMYTAFKTSEKVDDSYLYRVLKSELFVHKYGANTSASVDRRGSLRWKQFRLLKLHLPPSPNNAPSPPS